MLKAKTIFISLLLSLGACNDPNLGTTPQQTLQTTFPSDTTRRIITRESLDSLSPKEYVFDYIYKQGLVKTKTTLVYGSNVVINGNTYPLVNDKVEIFNFNSSTFEYLDIQIDENSARIGATIYTNDINMYVPTKSTVSKKRIGYVKAGDTRYSLKQKYKNIKFFNNNLNLGSKYEY